MITVLVATSLTLQALCVGACSADAGTTDKFYVDDVDDCVGRI